MRQRLMSVLLSTALLLAIALPAAASMSGTPSSSSEPPPQSPDTQTQQLGPRQQAEKLYGSAYDDIAKAGQELQKGKANNAEKKFKSALSRARDAVALDTTYHEAWNLVGYASRKLGDYPQSLDAYAHCLRIKPDYVPAREYLGEAYVELGRMAEAREQLGWLQRLNAPDQAKLLETAIAARQAAHPDSSAAAPAAPPADSSRASTSSGSGSGR